MRYWEAITAKYPAEFLEKSDYLKTFREVRNGAILAALWTKADGNKYYVSFPTNEPADVDIYKLIDLEFKGIPSYRLEKMPVQLTRCSIDDRESLIKQITRKNKPALSNMSLVVHIQASSGNLDIGAISREVASLGTVYPDEIALIAPIESGSRTQRYAQALIYPLVDGDKFRESTVDYDDQSAFFIEPGVLQSRLGTGTEFEEIGSFIPIVP